MLDTKIALKATAIWIISAVTTVTGLWLHTSALTVNSYRILNNRDSNVQKRTYLKRGLTQSSVNGVDRRTSRTRKRLSGSLIDLIQEKGFDAITVQEVADRAQVSRSSFYTHFEDKDDLFLQQFSAMMQALGASLSWGGEPRQYRLATADFFEHVGAMRTLYNAMVVAHRLDHSFKIGRIVLTEEIEKRVRFLAFNGTADNAGVPPALLAHHIATTLMSLLLWWMDHHQPYTPIEMEAYFHRLILAA